MPDNSYASTSLEASGVTSVVFSADETRFFVARSDGAIDVFDTATQAKITTWHIGTSLRSVSISQDGSFLLAVEGNTPSGTSVLYRVDTSNGSHTTYSEAGKPF